MEGGPPKKCRRCGTINLPYARTCDTCGFGFDPVVRVAGAASMQDSMSDTRPSEVSADVWGAAHDGLPVNYGFVSRNVIYCLNALIGTLLGTAFVIPLVFIFLWLTPGWRPEELVDVFQERPVVHFLETLVLAAIAWISGGYVCDIQVAFHEWRLRRLALKDDRDFVFLLRSFAQRSMDAFESKDVLIDGRSVIRPHYLMEDIEKRLCRLTGLVMLQSERHALPGALTRSVVLHRRVSTCLRHLKT
jgi:hypothetical protein